MRSSLEGLNRSLSEWVNSRAWDMIEEVINNTSLDFVISNLRDIVGKLNLYFRRNFEAENMAREYYINNRENIDYETCINLFGLPRCAPISCPSMTEDERRTIRENDPLGPYGFHKVKMSYIKDKMIEYVKTEEVKDNG